MLRIINACSFAVVLHFGSFLFAGYSPPPLCFIITLCFIIFSAFPWPKEIKMQKRHIFNHLSFPLLLLPSPFHSVTTCGTITSPLHHRGQLSSVVSFPWTCLVFVFHGQTLWNLSCSILLFQHLILPLCTLSSHSVIPLHPGVFFVLFCFFSLCPCYEEENWKEAVAFLLL